MEPHKKFGIDEIYILQNSPPNLLGKLQQRAALSFDADDTIVKNNVANDMILIFHKRVQSRSMIYRFLEFLNNYTGKDDISKKDNITAKDDTDDYMKSNTLINEDELFEAIKSQKFFLVTPQILNK